MTKIKIVECLGVDEKTAQTLGTVLDDFFDMCNRLKICPNCAGEILAVISVATIIVRCDATRMETLQLFANVCMDKNNETGSHTKH